MMLSSSEHIYAPGGEKDTGFKLIRLKKCNNPQIIRLKKCNGGRFIRSKKCNPIGG